MVATKTKLKMKLKNQKWNESISFKDLIKIKNNNINNKIYFFQYKRRILIVRNI